MDHQLVLQFKEHLLDFDALIELEDRLQELLAPIADMDGHDMGNGEANIFIFTSDPVATFERAKPLLSEVSMLNSVRVAHRSVHSGIFTVLWPEFAYETFVIA